MVIRKNTSIETVYRKPDSAKSCAWRACVLACFACLRACLRACVLTYFACLRASVLGLLGVFTWLACLRAYVPSVLACMRAWLLR